MRWNSNAALVACGTMLLLGACATMDPASRPARFADGVLVTPAGMTLYTFDRDPVAGGRSACAGPCAANWPPLRASAEDRAGGDFSILVREDGSRQWAYKGKPLYLWMKDQKPGDKSGDGLNKVWHLVQQESSASAGASAPITSGY
jgi:predicted lipoprotein with Yx(FWY)xxD motif